LHIAVLVPAGGKEQKRQRKNENKKTKNLRFINEGFTFLMSGIYPFERGTV